jgi:structural maintenance of chromosome 1
VIGPFKQFTSIIGPNGSGKSNLMDAISFVLGVQSAQLRGAALRDLVYSFDLADKETRRTAYVKLVYEAEDGVETVFSRHITAAGTGEYKVDGKACPAEAYNDRLKSHGILVKARNFLVFQGDIESVASKSPKDLTVLIEQISGSEDIKKDYEDAMKSRTKAEEDQHAAFTKRKTLAAQRKQMKEQKEEAERHARMTEELNKLRVEHVLFKLFHIDFDVKRHADEIETAERALAAHDAKVAAALSEMEEKRALKAARQKEVLVLERKIATHKSEVDGGSSGAVRTREEISRGHKKLELATKQLEKYNSDVTQSLVDIARLEKDLRNTQAAEQVFEKDLEKKGKKAVLDLGEAQMAEYNKKKEEAGAKTFKLRQEREGLVNALQADGETESRLGSTVTELESRSTALGAARDDEVSRLATLESTALEARREMASSKETEKALENEKRKSRAKQEHFNNKIEELSGKLRSAKADRKETERETRALEAITAMKRLLPGVHGRVTDLMKVSQKKYNLAVITVLGKEADAVVVDDSKTAKECVQYLKEQRVSPMTFLPLKEIKVHEPDEALRRLGGTAKLVLDVVHFDATVGRAMIYALGNDTMVCDTHQEAKKITFGGDRRFKIVSVDGTMIKKSGEMTGGSSGSLEQKASRFDAEEVEQVSISQSPRSASLIAHTRLTLSFLSYQLRADRQAAEDGLAKLRPVAALVDEERAAAARLARLERDAQYYAVDIKMAGEKVDKLAKELSNIDNALAKALPELQAAKRACAVSRAALSAVDQKVHAVEDAVYASFSKSVGVANIREYEAHNLDTQERSAEERSRFTQQRAKLTEQLNFERSRDVVGPQRRAEAEIAKTTAELARLTAAAETAKATTEKAKALVEGWERDASTARTEANTVDAEIRDLRERHGTLNTEGSKTQRVIANKTAAAEALREQRADIIAASRMERLSLPRADGDADEETLALPAPEKDNDDDDNAMNTEDGTEAEKETGSAWRAAAFKAVLDYDDLPQRLKQAPRPSDRERLDDELRVETEAKLAALAKLEPNMKAIDQYESVKERELAQAEDLELKRSLTKHAQEAFESLKTTRTETFMAAFEHIASAIDRVYKELTQSESHPLGGTAYLSLESPEEPYNHGVKFTAMPPTKRFRDMEQLSGGEKTMAALALLFAIHRCVWARLSQIRHTARFTSNAGDCGGPITVTVVHTSSNTRPRHD